jgi:hypothetical protein
MVKRIYISFYLCVAILSCSDKKDKVNDKELPVIQLLTPSNNQSFTGGQVVNVTANISDNDKLYEIHVHVYNNGTGQLLLDIHRLPDASIYSLNENISTQAAIQYKIQVVAVDKSANQQVQTVFISTT